MNNPIKVLLALIMMVVAFVTTGGAQAADTWLPKSEFRADRSIYLDPTLSNHSQFPVSLPGLEAKLQGLSSTHGLKFYFVMTQQGTETNPTSDKFAVWKLDQFVAMVQSKLPADDYAVVLLVRSNADPSKFSFAANGGNRLQQYGLTGSFFGSSNSPLNANQSIYLPNDPAGFGNAVAVGINAAVTEHFAAIKRQEAWRLQQIENDKQAAIRQAEQRRLQVIEDARLAQEAAERNAAIQFYLMVGGPPGAILIILGIMFIMYRSRKAATDKLVATWRERMTASSTNYQRLETGYFGFLTHQAAWQEKFKGTTAAKFKVAVTDFANYSARQLAANRRFLEAEKLASGARYPFALFGTFSKVNLLLTQTSIKITGQELPLEMASLYGGLVEEKEYKPEEVLAEMEQLFDKTNKALAAIKGAFDGAAQNKKDIDVLDASVVGLKPDMQTVGLNFDPYETIYKGLVEGKTAFLAILDSNPLDAFAGSEKVEAGFEALKATLLRAIGIQKSFADTDKAIGKSTTRVATVRGQVVDYKYALTGKELRELASGATFLLNEENGNPDNLLADANDHFVKAKAACLAGELDKADGEKAKAEKAAADANALVDAIFAAKALVEKQLVPVRTSLGKLQGDIPGATTAVTEIKAEFLAKNFPGEPEKLDNANAVSESTEAELAKVKKAYEEQRYLAARKRLETVGGDIQNATDDLVEIHSRLAKLRELRSHSRKIVQQSADLSAALATKLATNSFTTSQATDQAYQRQMPVLGIQQIDVVKDITDWPAAADSADKLLAALKAVDKAIDDEKAQHANAVAAIDKLSAAINEAASYVRGADTRRPAQDKLANANNALATVGASAKRAKSDWASIARQATEAKSMAVEAKNLAIADKEAADTARSAISSAKSNIGSTPTSYDRGVTADLSGAWSQLRSAESSLSSGNYEQATTQARSASSAADSAQRSAESRVAAILAEEARKRREEEERQAAARRAAAAAAAAAEASRRRSSSNSGGGFSGGGRSGGGSSGGGRSGGGGSF
jgi:uncharacterized membrane protein YgcG